MKLGNIKNKLMPMIADAHWAEQLLDKEDNQFTRRTYVRNMFAMIEGSIWVLKQTILNAPTSKGQLKRLTVAEYALLSDKTYDLKSNGHTKEQQKYLKLPENLRFTFNMLTKYFGITFDLDVKATNWNNFLIAQKIRNRITHPRTVEELNISDSEIAACKEADSWFNELIVVFFKGLVANSNKNNAPNI